MSDWHGIKKLSNRCVAGERDMRLRVSTLSVFQVGPRGPLAEIHSREPGQELILPDEGRRVKLLVQYKITTAEGRRVAHRPSAGHRNGPKDQVLGAVRHSVHQKNDVIPEAPGEVGAGRAAHSSHSRVDHDVQRQQQ